MPMSRQKRRRMVARAWRAPAYLLGRLPVYGVGALCVVAPALAAGLTGLLLIGVPLLAAWTAFAIAAAPGERRAVRLLDSPPVRDPHVAPWSSPRERLREPATGREAAHALVSAVLAPLHFGVLVAWIFGTGVLLAAPFLPEDERIAAGFWTIEPGPGAWWAAPAGLFWFFGGAAATVALAHGQSTLTRALLGPRGEELRRQVIELERSRLRLADAFDVERRRIERDLHDGAQQQLVALAMTLDLARMELAGGDHAEAARLVDDAHAQATRTIAELRELIRAVHPPVLSERGLGPAVAELADRAALPVRVQDALPERQPVAVETAAYFVVSELLANAAKHSGATRVDVALRPSPEGIVVEVRDDGRGGADPAEGSGLRGLADRLAPVAGRLVVSSPPGGPTAVRADIPHMPS